jgi:hypothetical protein
MIKSPYSYLYRLSAPTRSSVWLIGKRMCKILKIICIRMSFSAPIKCRCHISMQRIYFSITILLCLSLKSVVRSWIGLFLHPALVAPTPTAVRFRTTVTINTRSFEGIERILKNPLGSYCTYFSIFFSDYFFLHLRIFHCILLALYKYNVNCKNSLVQTLYKLQRIGENVHKILKKKYIDSVQTVSWYCVLFLMVVDLLKYKVTVNLIFS